MVVTATLSKSLGAQGGAVLGSPALVHHLVNRARPFIFDTALNPAATGGALAALRVLRSQPDLPSRIAARVGELSSLLDVEPPAGAVLSVPMASPHVAIAAQAECLEHGCARRLLPAAVGSGRHLATAHHHQCRRARRGLGASHRRPHEGRRGAPVILVVTGTGTGVGKTVATAALAARASGSVIVVKPVQTGVLPGEVGDVDDVRRLAGCEVTELVRLPDPLAPDTAARLAGRHAADAWPSTRRGSGRWPTTSTR